MLGVNRGIERTSKVLMPLLALLLVGLFIHGLFLKEAPKGLAFLFVPDWSALTDPEVYLAALGQAFFSISVGLGTLITYGSYLPAKASIAGSALVIALGDTVFAILAGIIVFSAVFTYGVNPGEGPGLAFVTLPEIFNHMRMGMLIGSAFFLLLFVAALTSAISLLEIPVAFTMERFGVSRRLAVLTAGASAFAVGIPSSLGYGAWSDIRPGGRPILDAVDHMASNIFLPLSSLLIALFVGWHWSRAKALDSSSIADVRLAQLWLGVVKYIVPLVIGIVFARSLMSLAG
jgi:NSS family neurotransmitter:Na+ symporter